MGPAVWRDCGARSLVLFCMKIRREDDALKKRKRKIIQSFKTFIQGEILNSAVTMILKKSSKKNDFISYDL